MGMAGLKMGSERCRVQAVKWVGLEQPKIDIQEKEAG